MVLIEQKSTSILLPFKTSTSYAEGSWISSKIECLGILNNPETMSDVGKRLRNSVRNWAVCTVSFYEWSWDRSNGLSACLAATVMTPANVNIWMNRLWHINEIQKAPKITTPDLFLTAHWPVKWVFYKHMTSAEQRPLQHLHWCTLKFHKNLPFTF